MYAPTGPPVAAPTSRMSRVAAWRPMLSMDAPCVRLDCHGMDGAPMAGIANVSRLPERRLVAIFAADVAGYSRLMGQDEAATIRDLKAHEAVVLPMIEHFGGLVVDTAGDSILAEF